MSDKIITIDKDKYDALRAATQWYDAMPSSLNNVVGDRFHENISDFQHESLPPNIIDDEVGYVAFVEMRGIHLYVGNLYTDDDADEAVSYMILPNE
jgi:hypothetical protein